MNWDKEENIRKLLQYVLINQEKILSYIIHFHKYPLRIKLKQILIRSAKLIPSLKDNEYLDNLEKEKHIAFSQNGTLCEEIISRIIINCTWQYDDINYLTRTLRDIQDYVPLMTYYQIDIIKDLFPPPIQVEFGFNKKWLSKDVIGVTTRINQEKKYENMPILADALEEAGCTNELYLNHCRKRKYHYNGCWLIDEIKHGI